MQQKIKEAFDNAVNAGYGPMNQLIVVLSKETWGAWERKRAQLHQELRYLLEDYNAELKKGKKAKEETLQKYGDQIKTNLNNFEESDRGNPQLLFSAMETAQKALLAYARSDKTPKDTDEFTSAMEDYLSKVKQVGAYIKKPAASDATTDKSKTPGTSAK
jgi:hypothetical protein